MFWDEPVIDRILKDVEIIIGRPLEAGKALVGGERGQGVAANRKFDAVAACVEIAELAERIASAGRNDPDDFGGLSLRSSLAPLGGVFEPEPKAGFDLLGVGLYRADRAIDERALEIVARRRASGGN
jgi:hypothetical protein